MSKPLRIDGPTPDSFQHSWDPLRGSLMPGQRSELDVEILAIAFGKYKSLADVPPRILAGVGPQNIGSEIAGMSFTETVDLANKQSIKVQLPRQS